MVITSLFKKFICSIVIELDFSVKLHGGERKLWKNKTKKQKKNKKKTDLMFLLYTGTVERLVGEVVEP